MKQRTRNLEIGVTIILSVMVAAFLVAAVLSVTLSTPTITEQAVVQGKAWIKRADGTTYTTRLKTESGIIVIGRGKRLYDSARHRETITITYQKTDPPELIGYKRERN